MLITPEACFILARRRTLSRAPDFAHRRGPSYRYGSVVQKTNVEIRNKSQMPALGQEVNTIIIGVVVLY